MHLQVIWLSTTILLVSALSLSGTIVQIECAEAPTQDFSRVILFSWDGTQYDHLMQLYDGDNLIYLKQCVSEAQVPILRALITDHYTETNYGHPSLLSGMGQGNVQGCPDGITVWENIERWSNGWVTGSVAGKSKFSNLIFPYAKDEVDYWYAADTSANIVTNLAIEFVQNYSSNSFFLFVHYREPDYAGHSFGENSPQYDSGIIECDIQMGRILSALESEGIRSSTAILISTDHGFVENGKGHASQPWGAVGSDPNCYTAWIACNTGSVDFGDAASEFWDQNDVAPTIYSLVGLDDYSSRWPYIRGSAIWDRAFDVRDITITDIQISKSISSNQPVGILIFLENQGNLTEIPTISIHCNGNIIGTETLSYPDVPLFGLHRGASIQKISIVWDATDSSLGNYVISAQADAVLGGGNSQPRLAYTVNETDIADNTFTGRSILVTIPGDVNGDRLVNVLDLILIAIHLGHSGGDGHAIYTSDWHKCMNTDLDNSGQHDVLDLIICANHLGQRWS